MSRITHRDMVTEDTILLLRRLEQMYEMAVWSALGQMYMPVYGYDGQIVAYAPASDAIEQWHADLDAARTRRLNDPV